MMNFTPRLRISLVSTVNEADSEILSMAVPRCVASLLHDNSDRHVSTFGLILRVNLILPTFHFVSQLT
jgi:hypothetical protein